MKCIRSKSIETIILVLLITLLGQYSTGLFGQVFIDKLGPNIVPVDGDGVATPDYVSLSSFIIPAGNTPKVVVARLLVPSLAGLKFQIVPHTTVSCGSTNGRCPVEVEVGGGSVTIKESNTVNNLADVSAVSVSTITTAAGYAIVDVIINVAYVYNFTAAETWSLKVIQFSTPREYSGFIQVGDVLANVTVQVTQPKIHLESGVLDFGEIHVGIPDKNAPFLPVPIRNVGTATLQFNSTGVTDISPIFFTREGMLPPNLIPGQEIVNDFNNNANSPNSGLWVECKPGGLGNRNSSLTIDTNGGIETVELKAKGISLYGLMLMDVSTSMSYKPDEPKLFASPDPIEHNQRIWAAKQAGIEINNWIHDFTDGKAYFGLVTFPNSSMPSPPNYYIYSTIDQSQNNQSTINGAFAEQGSNGLKVTDNTPMKSGINAAFKNMNDRISNSNLQPNEADRPYLKQFILLLTDGYPYPENTERPTIPSDLTTIINNGIHICTVGYGAQGAGSVDWDLLKSIATETHGGYWTANSGAGTPFDLKKSFKNFLITQGLQNVKDPVGTIRRGVEKTHTVCIDKKAYGVSFVVDWNPAIDNGVILELITPDGRHITPSTQDISFHKGNTFAMYVLKGKWIRGGLGAGKWTLKVIGGNSLPSNVDTYYSYNVIVQSIMKMTPTFSKEFVHTGKDLLLEVELTGIDPNIRKRSRINIDYNIPKQSMGTWISSMKNFDTQWLVRPNHQEQVQVIDVESMPSGRSGSDKYKNYVPETIMGEPATMVQRKACALKYFTKHPFQNKRTKGTVQLYDDGTHGDKVAYDGVFSAHAPELRYDGIYDFFVRMFTAEESDTCVNRESLVNMYVPVYLNSELLGNQLELKPFLITPFFPPALQFPPYPKKGMIRKNVVFTPKDKFGNYWGPGHANEVTFKMKNAESLGPVVDNLDGSYIQVIEYKSGETPLVSVTASGVTSPEIKMKPSLPCYFGIKGGVNFANLSASGSTPVFDWNNKTGFCLGAFLTLNLSDYFALQPEAFFSRKGLKVDQITTNKTFNIDFIEAPVLLKFLLASRGNVSPSLFAGPFAAFKINDNITPAGGVPGIKTFDFGVTLGAGMDFALGSKLLVFDARYTRGLINIARVPAGTGITVKSKVFSFMIGIRF